MYSLIKRLTQFLRDGGPSGLAKALIAISDIMDIEYQIRSLFDLPVRGKIRDVSSSFIIRNRGRVEGRTTYFDVLEKYTSAGGDRFLLRDRIKYF